MKISTLFKIAGKSIFACALFLILAFMIGLLVENKVDITLWRQGVKDAMGIIVGIATVIAGIVVTIQEMDSE